MDMEDRPGQTKADQDRPGEINADQGRPEQSMTDQGGPGETRANQDRPGKPPIPGLPNDTWRKGSFAICVMFLDIKQSLHFEKTAVCEWYRSWCGHWVGQWVR